MVEEPIILFTSSGIHSKCRWGAVFAYLIGRMEAALLLDLLTIPYLHFT